MTGRRRKAKPQYVRLQILAFPFYLENILVLLLFSAMFITACLWASLPGWMGLRSVGFWFICITLFFNYVFVIVDFTSRGMQRVPKLSGEMVFPTHDLRLYTIALLTICHFTFVFGSWETASMPLRLAITFFSYPLMFSMLIVHQDLKTLLNPLKLVGTLYLFSQSRDALVFFICQLVTAGFMYFAFTTYGDISFAHIFWQIPVTLTLLFITFRALGVALNTRGPSFGLSVLQNEATFDEAISEAERIELDKFILRLHRWVRVHEYRKAFEMIIEYQAEHGHQSDDALFVRLSSWDDKRLAAMLGAQLAERLLLAHETDRAMKVFRESYDMAPTRFRFTNGTVALSFLNAAGDAASQQRLIECLERFEEHYPRHPMTTTVKQKLSRLKHEQ